MNWWDHPDWLAFAAQVAAEPKDDTRRLVAADWLDERGTELAGAAAARGRAELIRVMCRPEFTDAGGKPLPLWVDAARLADPWVRDGARSLVSRATQGTPLAGCCEVEWFRGFPRTACFEPWHFNDRVVPPVMRAEPVLRVEVAYVTPEGNELEPGADQWDWECGPEDAATGRFGSWAEMVRTVATLFPDTDAEPIYVTMSLAERIEVVERRLRNGDPVHPHVYYGNPHLLPAPVYDALPPLAPGLRRNLFPSPERAVANMHRAAWRAAWTLAGVTRRPRKDIDPDRHRAAYRAECAMNDESLVPEPEPEGVPS